ncbi:DNA-formamidopyrimidine glycosylase family protein [Luteimonas sp. 100069]|uniref:DNA-formamidopyrimidine glycosylase family protein n=1 Tax=Luteimonas sp. 100069 TaxID=2006109 RepID=UPI000F4DD99C|nr:DNA-formamidopyrimidine glycosylase family protein [Luteimonas sp. 100069]RPD85867.1 endonuclease VIII [Luteimonas sp. 100069]
MPEGPETHELADRLSTLLVDEVLTQVRFIDPRLQRKRGLLEGKRVLAVEARGKALLTAVSSGWTLYTHSQLFGFWRLVDDVDALPDGARPRVLLVTARGVAALYAAPSISLWRTDELDAQPYLAKLGPDVLDPAVDAAGLLAHMDTPRFAGRTLAVLLLDQGFAAGMGNYLRSEVLYHARLSPYRILRDLTAAERRRLAKALLDVPRRAYRAKHGDILPPGKDYLARTRATFGFEVYEHKGDPCPRDGGTIVEERLAARRLYWCPACQH